MNRNETQDAFHGGFRLSNVYGRIAPGQREEAVAMWLAAGVLPEPEARRRTDEIVYMIRDPEGRLVGVNTVYARDLPGSGERFYFYRTFVREPSRGLAGLGRKVLHLTWAFLKERPCQPAASGLMIVTENPKLMRPGAARELVKAGFHRLGRDPRGRDVWCKPFDDRHAGTALPSIRTPL